MKKNSQNAFLFFFLHFNNHVLYHAQASEGNKTGPLQPNSYNAHKKPGNFRLGKMIREKWTIRLPKKGQGGRDVNYVSDKFDEIFVSGRATIL